MNPVHLPPWRRTATRRFAVTLLAMLPAVVMQSWNLGVEGLIRLATLLATALVAALLTTSFLPPVAPAQASRVTTPHSRPTNASRSHRSGAALAIVLDAFAHAVLLAALWPVNFALWPAVAGLVVALVLQRLFGGWQSSPFPPSILALATALMLASGSATAGALMPSGEIAPLALAWLAGGAALVLLRLRPWQPMLCFALPLALFLSGPGANANHWLGAALATAFIASDRLHLPASTRGQCLVAALAGLGTAAIWLAGAPAAALAFPWLLATFLSPWIEQHTLLRPSARPSTK